MEFDPHIIIAFLAGDATEEERNALRAWREASPRHEEEFQRKAGVWQLLSEVPEAVLVEPEPVQPPDRAETIRSLPTRSQVSRPKRRVALWLLPAAASALLGVALGALWAGRAAPERFASGEVITGVDEIATVTLEDGTVVRLRGESRLEFGPAIGKRDVFLDGQAYFAVPPGQDEPFRVHTRNGQVTVLGTRFDVASRNDDVRVVVVQGAVEMGVGEQRVNLRANEGGRVGPNGEPIVEEVPDVYRETDWVGAFIAYEATPLAEVAREFESRFGVRIEISNPELESRTISGWFVDQTPAEMFGNICLAVDAQCETGDELLRMDLREDAEPAPARVGA